uniref:Uncharacterized protein n=1 Tax=Solibacter usitatus (strain Ellin6076) TaxID=234267 RepID=Q01Y85_SOLUE
MSLDVETVRAQINRLVESKSFETSEVHRRLLQYLAEKSLTGEAERLKEYTIGLEAFSKPPSYDPKHDSIVRLQVGRLRQKLSAYYQTEANGDPVLVSLPKGAFKLNFEVCAPPEQAQQAAPDSSRRVFLLGVALAVVGLWAIAATIFSVRAARTSAVDPWTTELEALWGPMLQSNRSTVVCLGTPLFVRFPNLGFLRDPKVNDWADIEKADRLTETRKLLGASLGSKDILPSYNFTGAGEASAAFALARLLSTRKKDLRLTRSSIVSWQQIMDEDVIFVGPPKFNLQLQAAAMKQDIVIEPDGIRNLKPRPGEPAYLPDIMVQGKTSEGETHALISRTPGLSGVGELLVIAGNASPDTFAAAEWLTQPLRARELVRRLRNSAGQIPRYFQVVIKVGFKQGIPVESSYVFHHVVDDPKPVRP